MAIAWHHIPAGVFTEVDNRWIALKVPEMLGTATAVELYRSRAIRVVQYQTPKGRVVGFAIERLRPRLRCYVDEHYVAIFQGTRPAAHHLDRTVLDTPFLQMHTFRVQGHTDYFFVSRIREAATASDTADDTSAEDSTE